MRHTTDNCSTANWKPTLKASAFGSLLPGRFYNPDEYKYGFNGKENDNEFSSNTGTHLDFGARIYDSRLGRWMSVDPLAQKYSFLTPYNFCGNTPIQAKDPDGRLIIFINGLWGEDLNLKPLMPYWGKDWVFDLKNHWSDFNELYFDGSIGGQKNLVNNASTEYRQSIGFSVGHANASSIIQKLNDGETIKFITNSMGAAFQRGFSEGLMTYVRERTLANLQEQVDAYSSIGALENSIKNYYNDPHSPDEPSLEDLKASLLYQREKLSKLIEEKKKLDNVKIEIVVDLEPHQETKSDPDAESHYFVLSDKSKYQLAESIFVNAQPVQGAMDASIKNGKAVMEGHHSRFADPYDLPKAGSERR